MSLNRPVPWFRLSALWLALLPMFPDAAFADSGWQADARLRYEQVDDDAFARDASATTLRLRFGYLFEPAPRWSMFVEGEHVQAFGSGYNSTANGHVDRPMIADPESTELNRAWLAWQGDRFGAKAGRQRVGLDNQRFAGNVGWRQNEQTFDAVALDFRQGDVVALRYLYLDRVHRINSDRAINPLLRERRLDSHLFNARFSPGGGQQLTGYAYLHEDRDVAADSAATLGVRWTGKRGVREGWNLGWSADWARQRDHGNQPQDFTLDYRLLEGRLDGTRIGVQAGWEVLAGDGRRGFATPLATLHAFNGWADRFAVTPPDGLDDRWLGLGGSLGTARWAVVWHEFRAARGGADFGHEWDASVTLPVPGPLPLNLLTKYASYRSAEPGADVDKVWLQVEWRGP